MNQEIEQLPEQCRKVFSMIYFEGKTEEIAYIMDISVKTVRNHKSRAIELLHISKRRFLMPYASHVHF
ncbi:hypothetical protein CS542_07950 [Pedobacter sp. IW39]|nr:hypothetical protein CS542_07950 [Pedobacter sp. IW39]